MSWLAGLMFAVTGPGLRSRPRCGGHAGSRKLPVLMKTQATLSALLVVFWAMPVIADAAIQPPAPIAGEFITAFIDIPGPCGTTSSTSVVGSLIRTDVRIEGCLVPGFIVVLTEPIGALPAGTYTYEDYRGDDGGPLVLQSRQPIVVAAAPTAVPLATTESLVVLALALVAIAFVALPDSR
jgi:hypothetical protein